MPPCSYVAGSIMKFFECYDAQPQQLVSKCIKKDPFITIMCKALTKNKDIYMSINTQIILVQVTVLLKVDTVGNFL